ncbi:class I SAM-dependent methyltransferase [Campylobacter jejuni]|uniref:Methyltransferase domain-containing protein n=1 Tax=Campylobacter jejuni TaxID=197 RepID=A0A690V2Y4_CAMJU|nr:class I SAM-dependent methyltransferase [Campylobacter jejuni]EAJ5194452.1 class I SAM-dependent methyltransferase [Campylobacter jejuni]EAK0574192.1 class I SAM-dependent methyltransferase [Campylobacter jejuni]EDP7703166.1 methyltransferase domain-containing protein [Campylobacter jejuni]EDP8235160.1 methyltransferase domain-containing protein [Campylobacter jejuni]EFV4334127.1 class I SAM-dependent methyltransferase [Campylobacter jejuni]
MKKYISNEEISNNLGSNEKIWENIFSQKEWGKYPSENVIRFIARNFYNVQDRSKINILELGFGTGANLWFCAREGFKVSGIEWSKTGLERFRARLKDENLSTQIEQIEIGDYLEKLDLFKNESFDAWMDSYSLAYNDFEKTKQIIKKAMKKLKIGGKFFSITPSLYNEGFEKDANLGYHLVKPVSGTDAFTGVIRYCDEEDLKRLYEGEGYKITSIKIHIQKDLEKQLNELYIIEGERYE